MLYNLDRHAWPTDVDLMDFMLLLQARTTASQAVLKGGLLAAAVAYVLIFVWLYRRRRSQPI